MIVNTNTPEGMNNLNNQKKKNFVLIWFYATWCGHCQNMEETWENVKENHSEELDLAQVESEDYMNNYTHSSNEDRITGYPTLRLYHKNKMIGEYDGDRSYEDIERFIKNYLDKHNNANKKNMLVIKAKKSNHINHKLVEKLRKGFKNQSKKRKMNNETLKKSRKTGKKGKKNGKNTGKKNGKKGKGKKNKSKKKKN